MSVIVVFSDLGLGKKNTMENYKPKSEFDEYFQGLLKKNDPSSNRLYAAVTQMLFQFHLQRRYSVSDVLNEVYIRGTKFVESGGVIQSYPGWVRGAAYNVVRENKRRNRKETTFLEGMHAADTPAEEPDVEIDQQYLIVKQLFGLLSAYDQKLMQLKVIDKLSWRDVRSELARSGEPDSTEAALRKRKQRVLESLRRQYEDID